MFKSQKPIESLIAFVSDAKEGIEALKEIYSKLPALLMQEHSAIQQRDIAALEALGETKAQIAESMENLGLEVKKSVRLISQFHSNVFELDESPTEFKLSDTCHYISELIEHFERDGFATQVLKHINERLDKLIQDFLQMERENRPLIEASKYLIQKLLQHNQQMYRFWTEVAQETMSNYNDKGIKRSSGQASLLNVKA